MKPAGRGSELAVGLGVVALGILVLYGVRDIGAGAGYDRIGPRVVPYVVAAGLIGFGLLLAVPRASGRRTRVPAEDVHRPPPLNWTPLFYLGLALILSLLLLEPAGFVLASSVQFWLAARAFHSRRPGRDAAVGLLLSGVVDVAFSRGLGLNLPPGLLEGLL